MYMCRSLLIFSNVNFKMAARQPYWNFCFRTLTLVWLSISTANLSGTILIYSVSPIYHGCVYRGIGYIAVACWTPFFVHPFRKFRGHAAQECDFSQNRGNSLNPVHSFEFGHLRGDYLGLKIVLSSFDMQRWMSMKDHTALCLHAEFVATHATPPLSLISRCRTRNMMLPCDSRPIYRALTYIAVPFLGPQQPAIYRAYTVYG